MRQVFGETLVELGKTNRKLIVLDGDCASSTRTILFGQAYPDRFFNCGIAESNMVSIAAGLAAGGFVPVASTFAFLMAMRAGDQVRSQVAHSNLNVKLAGGYCGLSDFADGSSHQSVADIAVMRALPNMTVLAPGGIDETRAAVAAAIAHEGPVYLRLARSEVGKMIRSEEPFRLGAARKLRPGDAVTLLSTGTMVKQVLEAAMRLEEQGIRAEVLHVPTIKPLDVDTISASLRKTGCGVTVEEHTIYGGFGSAVADLLAPLGSIPLERVGIQDRFGQSGRRDSLLETYGLTAEHIARKAHELVQRMNKE